MKSIIKVAAILLFVLVAGCGEEEKPVKAANTEVLKTQLEALEQARQVDQMVQDAAAQQRQKIEEGTQ
jgi:entry exclusion lipoprotein TrbK